MKSLLRLTPYIKPYRGLLILSVLLAVPYAVVQAAPAALLKYLVDDFLIRGDSNQLIFFPAAIVGLYGLNFAIRFAHYYSLRVVVARVGQRVKNHLFDHALGLSADYFSSRSTGGLISRVGSDPQYIDAGIAACVSLVREPIKFVLLFGYALRLDVWLTLVAFLILPPLAWIFSRTGKNLKRYIGRMTEENAGLFSSIQEGFSGIRVVKTFRLEKYVRKRFRERSDRFAHFLLKTAVLEELAHPLVEFLTAFAIAAVVYLGGRRVMSGEMTPGELLSFFFAFGALMGPLRSLNDANIKINQAAAACDRIFEVFDWQSHLIEAPDPLKWPGLSEGIRFEDVRFAYPDAPERVVLKGVSFSVQKGKVVAVVGASGAGKTTLAQLLPRIFDPTSGRILVDGMDISRLSLKDLRDNVAIVSQDVFLFNDTIAENIRCGRLHASMDEVREAARRANALAFIERLPDGFETGVGDRGQKLSGGERQRIAIARAFLREAPILVLDEATSNLDSAAERAVQDALDELMRDRTTIVIAHRLSTIRTADQILVMRDGLIVETGRHDDLVARGGEYSRFHALVTVSE